MATIKQIKAFKGVLENRGNVSKAMQAAGYSKAMSKNPHQLTQSKGWLELCDENGLTEDLLTKALVEDIKKKKGNRKGELELGFKVRGRLKETKEGDTYNTQVNVFSDEQLRRIAQRVLGNSSGAESLN